MTKKREERKCDECVEMLKRVLTSPMSRPRALLEAMGSSCDFTPTSNGVNVSFPEETSSNSTAVSSKAKQTHSRSMKTQSQVTDTAVPLAASAATSQQSQLKIECRPCGTEGPEANARAFVMGPTPLSIVLCSNRLYSLGYGSETYEMEQVLTHELIHIYDVRHLELDLRDCVNLAYSEIRAAREAECRDAWVQPYCVQHKALQATSNIFPKQAGRCVLESYQKAMQDLRPFGKNHDKNHSER